MRFISADRVFDGSQFLSQDQVLVFDAHRRFVELIETKVVDKNQVEQLEGILCPGFVNPHCHLELSHLQNKIPKHTGLPEFGKQVIQLRNQGDQDFRLDCMREADKAMKRAGIVAVGDISNGDESFTLKTESTIFYHTFLEVFGFNPADSETVMGKAMPVLQHLRALGLRASLAPHAPYSTSKELIARCSDYDVQSELPFSIHNQESPDETNFFMGLKSGFNDLYSFLGTDISWFKAPGTSSLQAYASALNKRRSLLVHNTATGKSDLQLADNRSVYWCFCPAANNYIENALPNFALFAHLKNSICIGTDSLASNDKLDLIAEINLIRAATPVFGWDDLLRAITGSAASALLLEDKFGSFIKGRDTGLNLLNLENEKLQLSKIIH